MAGKRSLASVVSQRRKSGCGLLLLSAFSSCGSHATTRCKFLRHSHVPFFIASASILLASSCCPPPMASSLYFSEPTATVASSRISLLGSMPVVVSISTGISDDVSAS
jgi:hypothetical protein